jgi:sigma-B regulation protein RsbU (phosphoserine phosphatase)
MKPAKEVGGDFYDFFPLGDDKVCVIIADVSGKGVPAALFMVVAKTLIKEQALSDKKLHEVFYETNNRLCSGNSANMFVTAFMAVLNIKTGVLEFVNAGHNLPFILRSGFVEQLELKRSFVLGGMEDFVYTTQSTRLEKGDMLFMYTDGVTEAMNGLEEFYSEERLESLLIGMQKAELGLKDILTHIYEDILQFEGGTEHTDDVTMLILRA